jgi:hypothetical protein
MGKKKWIPISKEKVIRTERWKYVLGLYAHQQYGRSCFRISKYIRDNGFFVGHFVVVPEDQHIVLPEIAKYIELAMEKAENLPNDSIESTCASASFRNYPLPGMG